MKIGQIFGNKKFFFPTKNNLKFLEMRIFFEKLDFSNEILKIQKKILAEIQFFLRLEILGKKEKSVENTSFHDSIYEIMDIKLSGKVDIRLSDYQFISLLWEFGYRKKFSFSSFFFFYFFLKEEFQYLFLRILIVSAIIDKFD